MEPKPPLPPDFGPVPPTKDPSLFAGTPRPVKLEEWSGKKLSELIMFMGRGLTIAEMNAARGAGVVMGDSATPPTEAPVDNSGFDLGSGGGSPKVNGVTANEFNEYTFDVATGQEMAELDAFGSPGKFFDEATFYVLSPNGAIMVPTQTVKVLGLTHKVLVSVPGAGKYRYIVKVNGSGRLAVQYNPR